MGQKNMQMTEHPCVLTLLQKENSANAVARDIGLSREAIFQLKRSAALFLPGMIPKRKSDSGAPRKTSLRTDKLLKREVTSYPFITSVELKKTSTMSFSTTSQSGQFIIDSRKISVYQVVVQPRSSCSLHQ